MTLTQSGKNILKVSSKFLKTNSAKIFTCGGVVGVVVTIATTIVETLRFKEEFDALEASCDGKPDRNEVLLLAGKHFWKVGLSGGATIGCFLKANSIHIAKEMALSVVAKTAQEELSGIKEKISQEFGPKKLQKIEHEITEERVQRETEHYPDTDITNTGTGFTEFEDPWTAKRFTASVDHIRHVWDDKIVPRLCDGDDVSYYDFVHLIREYDSRHKIPKFTEYLGFKGARDLSYHPPELYLDSAFKDYERGQTIASIQFSDAPVWSMEKEVYIN